MTWTCPECQGSMPVLAMGEYDEKFECPWCSNELLAFPEELEEYTGHVRRTVRVETDDDAPQGVLAKLREVIR